LADARISLKGVTKTFPTPQGRMCALSGVDLDVAEGEFVCVVGPSGCGKSSLLDIIAGLSRPDSGEVFCDGRKVSGVGRERVLIFQDGALFPWLTVRGNVEFGLKMEGVPPSERRKVSDALLGKVRLEAFADARPHELSGGMRQRVAIIRALAMDPEVLLMDEPFAALDAQARDSLHGELQRVWSGSNKTIVFVTHNVQEAVCLGDRVVVMSYRPGRVKKVFAVNLPRPRHTRDPAIMGIVGKVLDELKEETEKALEDELSHGGKMA
jgi:NitT/TauT family transport system ATP-binding protein